MELAQVRLRVDDARSRSLGARGATFLGALLSLALGCAAPPTSSAAHATPRAATVEACRFGEGELALWPGPAPLGENSASEQIEERSADASAPDRSISGVSKPTMLPVLAPKPNGAAALVLPGGGYKHLAWDKEGVEVARWLTSLGVSAFVLKYRLPAEHLGKLDVALADAQRALRLIEDGGRACGIDPARVGALGFSAGGHLASQLATRFDENIVPRADAVDDASARPAFAVLLYPVISMSDELAHPGSKLALLGSAPTADQVARSSSELRVSAKTPPTFIAVSDQDKSVSPENSAHFADALRRAGVAHELHRYRDGRHGTGIRGATGDMAEWPAQCATWLAARGFLDAAHPAGQ